MHQQRQQQDPAQRNRPAENRDLPADSYGWGTHAKDLRLATVKRNQKTSSSFAFSIVSIPKVLRRFALWHWDSHRRFRSAASNPLDHNQHLEKESCCCLLPAGEQSSTLKDPAADIGKKRPAPVPKSREQDRAHFFFQHAEAHACPGRYGSAFWMTG